MMKVRFALMGFRPVQVADFDQLVANSVKTLKMKGEFKVIGYKPDAKRPKPYICIKSPGKKAFLKAYSLVKCISLFSNLSFKVSNPYSNRMETVTPLSILKPLQSA